MSWSFLCWFSNNWQWVVEGIIIPLLVGGVVLYGILRSIGRPKVTRAKLVGQPTLQYRTYYTGGEELFCLVYESDVVYAVPNTALQK